MSPLVAFFSRHGGKILFALALAVAMIEGVALMAAGALDIPLGSK